METAIYNPSRLRLLQPTLHSSSRSAIDMQSSSRSSFSLRGWAHAQPLVRVLVPVRTRVKCIVVRGESTDLTRPVSILTVVGEGSSSPLKNTPWEEVMQHTVSDYYIPFISLVKEIYKITLLVWFCSEAALLANFIKKKGIMGLQEMSSPSEPH